MTTPALSRDDALKLSGLLFDSLSQQSLEGIGDSLSPEVVWVAEFLDEGSVKGSDAVAEALKTHLGAFSGFLLTISEEAVPAVFENETLAFEFTIQGTNTGHLPGIGNTGRSIEGTGSAFISFDENGRISGIRTYWDWSSLMGQLGMRSFARPGPVPV